METNKPSMMTRRNALRIGIAGTGVLGAGLAPNASAAITRKPVRLKPGAVILFQGDSITDAGRDRKNKRANDPGSLGRGYAMLAAGALLKKHNTLDLQIHNRGISGHKVPDLDKRWQADCFDLKPDVLSILIGVNDIWHKLNGNYDGTVETYETGFTELILKTRAALPDTRIVICQPFVLRCGAVKDNWFPEFDQRMAAAKRVASKTNTAWVPFQDVFNSAVARNDKPEYWAGDGVHPSLAGHQLMADTWLKATGL